MEMCVLCGEAEAVKRIPNPNGDEPYIWEVCEECAAAIKEFQSMTLEIAIARSKGEPIKDILTRYGFTEMEGN